LSYLPSRMLLGCSLCDIIPDQQQYETKCPDMDCAVICEVH
ncbi:3094_t:CDS:1, partial [Acaulospora colombiana]